MQPLQPHSTSPLAKPGDLIIVQEKYNSLMPLTLACGAVLNNRYGRFLHDDLLGRPLGCRWLAVAHPSAGAGAQQCAGFVHALAPTPHLWSLAMRHRTQIVYPHDAALIALHLDLRPGALLLEAGTGSGSASLAFARVLAPRGRVRSFEFHADRARAAQRDFRALGVAGVVSVAGGVDVVKEGFVGVDDAQADAVFLDLPAPYLMGREVARVLKPNGTVCTFSPCLEQVQRSAEMFRRGPFHSVRTLTAPMRTYETREQVLGTPGFSQMSARGDEEAGSEADSGEGAADVGRKRRRGSAGAAEVEVAGDEGIRKRRMRTAGAERLAMAGMKQGQHEGRVIRVAARLHSRPFSSMKGHTSYLTFARRRRGEIGGERDNADGVGNGVKVHGKGEEDRESCAVS